MTPTLSAVWFAQINARLAAAASSVPPPPPGTVRVIFEFSNAPENEPDAMTFCVSDGAATLTPTRADTADVTVRLDFDDAVSLAQGALTGGQALRDGRLKVRGDTDALNHFGAWIVAAQSAAADTPP